MKDFKSLVLGGIATMILNSCGVPCTDNLKRVSNQTEISESSEMDADFPEIKKRLAIFRKNSKNNAICNGELSADECIIALDKLIALSTTSLFPTNRFEMVRITRAFRDVGTDGWLDINFASTQDEIANSLAKQPDFLLILRQKTSTFRANSKNNVICGYEVNAQQCLLAIDKLITLSKTNLFPNDHFEMVRVMHSFKNVGTDGWLAIDFDAKIGDIEAHLAKQ